MPIICGWGESTHPQIGRATERTSGAVDGQDGKKDVWRGGQRVSQCRRAMLTTSFMRAPAPVAPRKKDFLPMAAEGGRRVGLTEERNSSGGEISTKDPGDAHHGCATPHRPADAPARPVRTGRRAERPSRDQRQAGSGTSGEKGAGTEIEKRVGRRGPAAPSAGCASSKRDLSPADRKMSWASARTRMRTRTRTGCQSGSERAWRRRRRDRCIRPGASNEARNGAGPAAVRSEA